tara:strand:- start:2006 stop:3025 length:1020 start_codon:yes stop_codon:yes gene_type:complete
MKKIWAVMIARQKEFYRDRSSMGWNLAFPFFVVLGFAFAFSNGDQKLYKVGLMGDFKSERVKKISFFKTKYVEFVETEKGEKSVKKLKHHKFDLLLLNEGGELSYWTNKSSPKGYFLEKILLSDLKDTKIPFLRQEVQGEEIRYVDWLIPGILSMNMMFSSLFGVGYVIVRYRKNGVLRRLKATPLKAYEFLMAQVLARLVILMVIFNIVLLGCSLMVDFKIEGSYLDLLIVFFLGGLCLTSFGLFIAARVQSEEFAGGLLNLITWPMMFLSGVWFSLEGAHPFILKLSKIFPLTHMNEAARAIINEGMGLGELTTQMTALLIMTFIFIIGGARFFKWD